MSKFMGTIIGGGIGWILAGPLGALLGGWLGSQLASDERKMTGRIQDSYTRTENNKYGDTRAGDFAIAMLALFAHISRADGKITSPEVRYVKDYLIEKFGTQNARDLMMIYKEIIHKTFDINQLTAQIKRYMDYYTRLELVHVLYGIARADGIVHPGEQSEIRRLAFMMGINETDLQTIETMFLKAEPSPFEILNIPENADVDTIKKAYREMANKYHPDKVANLGPEIRELAEEKFKTINEAYQKIRKIKGF